MVRFDGDSGPLAAGIENTIKRMDASRFVVPRTIGSMMQERVDRLRPFAEMVLLLACLAVALALVGLYGVVAYSTTRRTREFGIRMALGATRGRIMLSELVAGARKVGIGLLFGVLLALPAGLAWERLSQGGAFQLSPSEFGLVCLGAGALLAVAAMAAIYVPARRAMKVDPMVALRHE